MCIDGLSEVKYQKSIGIMIQRKRECCVVTVPAAYPAFERRNASKTTLVIVWWNTKGSYCRSIDLLADERDFPTATR